MASCNFTIKFDATELNKLIRVAQESVFILMQDDFSELENILNINGILDTDDLIED